MSSPPIIYEIPFSQAFYNKGVDVGPPEHAEGRLAILRQTCINVALLDSKVSAVQFGTLFGNGVGTEWTIHFTEKDFKLNVLYDERRHPRFGPRSRKIGYILSVIIVQTNIPNTGVPSDPPRHILVTLS